MQSSSHQKLTDSFDATAKFLHGSLQEVSWNPSKLLPSFFNIPKATRDTPSSLTGTSSGRKMPFPARSTPRLRSGTAKNWKAEAQTKVSCSSQVSWINAARELSGSSFLHICTFGLGEMTMTGIGTGQAMYRSSLFLKDPSTRGESHTSPSFNTRCIHPSGSKRQVMCLKRCLQSEDVLLPGISIFASKAPHSKTMFEGSKFEVETWHQSFLFWFQRD